MFIYSFAICNDHNGNSGINDGDDLMDFDDKYIVYRHTYLKMQLCVIQFLVLWRVPP
jgi:hypothetical protein